LSLPYVSRIDKRRDIGTVRIINDGWIYVISLAISISDAPRPESILLNLSIFSIMRRKLRVRRLRIKE